MPTYSKTKPHYKIVALTTGDEKGIGFEVAVKALCDENFLRQYDKEKNVIFILLTQKNNLFKQNSLRKLLLKHWATHLFTQYDGAVEVANDYLARGRKSPAYVHLKTNFTNKPNRILLVSTDKSPTEAVIAVARDCINKKVTSLVTGPLSKTEIKKSGYQTLGHTGLFKWLLPKAELYMGFVGDHFNVLLGTDHIPISKIEPALSAKKIKSIQSASVQFKKIIKSSRKPAFLGLNPHSGEKGLIGTFEKKLKLKNHFGPLVPDAAFLKKNWNKFSHYVCWYHDQGLIPFKTIHGQDSGVHLTVGLPFVRTSVDHGTAFDLYNKNVANCSSMRDALSLNLKLIKGR